MFGFSQLTAPINRTHSRRFARSATGLTWSRQRLESVRFSLSTAFTFIPAACPVSPGSSAVRLPAHAFLPRRTSGQVPNGHTNPAQGILHVLLDPARQRAVMGDGEEGDSATSEQVLQFMNCPKALRRPEHPQKGFYFDKRLRPVFQVRNPPKNPFHVLPDALPHFRSNPGRQDGEGHVKARAGWLHGVQIALRRAACPVRWHTAKPAP